MKAVKVNTKWSLEQIIGGAIRKAMKNSYQAGIWGFSDYTHLKSRRLTEFIMDQILKYSEKQSKCSLNPEKDGLPKLADLHGMAPNCTGNLTSEQFIDQLRNETEK